LKFKYERLIMEQLTSLPAWGEWIEIRGWRLHYRSQPCLSPHGESGLKSGIRLCHGFAAPSLPAWGEWIEIKHRPQLNALLAVSPRMGRVD